MSRFLLGLLLISSCGFGVVKKGGDKAYTYNPLQTYKTEELKTLAPEVVETSTRNPQQGELKDLFSSKQPGIKRVGIMVFESSIQPTRSGLAGDDHIYLSAQGKQLLTERLLSIWEQSFNVLNPDVEYVKVSQIKKAKTFKLDGSDVTDEILGKRTALNPDDIFYLPKGKTTTSSTILNPRGMRDFSLALVPATELMSGPKFSEHAKHSVNDLARELNLDAVIIVMSDLHWTSAHTDKHSGEVFPEQAVVGIKSSILVPLSKYHERLKNLGEKRIFPSTTIAFRTYEAVVKTPVVITVPDEKKNFEYIEAELIKPMLKTYNDLAQMVELQMAQDFKEASH